MSAVALPSHLQPKPYPIFGHTPTSDDENCLPDTLATIMVDTKPMATAVSKVASGKWPGCGTKTIKVKWGLGKRKVRVDSELEDGVVNEKWVGFVGQSTGWIRTSLPS